MADIRHEFLISAPPARVFQAISTPEGLDAWWTKSSQGEPREGERYKLGFSQGYDWDAVVRSLKPGEQFELELTNADEDWTGTRVGFALATAGRMTRVSFHHTGWREANQHFCVSTFCWAMYLRLLKRYVEAGERIPYEKRLEA